MPALFPLLLFVAVSTLSPGGATTLATTSGANFGLVRSLPLILGIALGLMAIAALAALGLGGLIAQHPLLQVAVHALGTLYLLWLALALLRAQAPNTRGALVQPLSMGKAMLLLAANPKSWAMSVSAAATFAPLAAGPGGLAVLLGLAFAIAAVVSLTLWCLLGALLARVLRTPLQWRCFNALMAALLVLSLIPTWS